MDSHTDIDTREPPSDNTSHPDKQSPLKATTSQVEDNNQIVMVNSDSATQQHHRANLTKSSDEENFKQPDSNERMHFEKDGNTQEKDKTMDLDVILPIQLQSSTGHEDSMMIQIPPTRTWKRSGDKDGRLQRQNNSIVIRDTPVSSKRPWNSRIYIVRLQLHPVARSQKLRKAKSVDGLVKNPRMKEEKRRLVMLILQLQIE
ncbi:organic hydroperoxide resistance protein-like 1 [Striga asiatica]|uniref:Organic hydroperoxide resistance protein-like 1 n=1 Tax=Striga asiatica TaxID=4170 RepID=A0A5A7Q3P1_STRAF|nr:organic hydroperoxide resistance protein-like 1 [Striga asiatica]